MSGPRWATFAFRMSGQVTLGTREKRQRERAGCVQSTALGPRSSGPEEVSSSFNKEPRLRRAVPPVPCTSPVTAWTPGIVRMEGARMGPQGPPLPAGCSAWAPSPPQKCEFHTCRGVPPPLPQMPWPLSETDTCVCICPGQENVPGFHSAAGWGPTSAAGCFVFVGDRLPAGQGARGRGQYSCSLGTEVPTLGGGRADYSDTHTQGAFTVTWVTMCDILCLFL